MPQGGARGQNLGHEAGQGTFSSLLCFLFYGPIQISALELTIPSDMSCYKYVAAAILFLADIYFVEP